MKAFFSFLSFFFSFFFFTFCALAFYRELGPFLFPLYKNDLPNCLQYSQPRMYTDDTSITFAGSDVDQINNYVDLDLETFLVCLAANN